MWTCTGEVQLVTGASPGIGVETARALASAGAEVTLAVRNVAAGAIVAAAIAEELPTGSSQPRVAQLDLAKHLWADDGITANALMPGNVAGTALARHMGPDDLANFGETTDLDLPPSQDARKGRCHLRVAGGQPRRGRG